MSETVGVIGGMGPEATVELMKRIIEGTAADDDCDHIHVIADNNPRVPSRIKAILENGDEDPAPVLAKMAVGLERAGADLLVIPCNTAHYYHPAIQRAVTVPVWNIIELTRKKLHELPGSPNQIGLLASTAVQKIGLYESYFNSPGDNIIYPQGEHQASVMAIIRAVKAGSVTPDLLAGYQRAVRQLAEQGATVLVIACTELSMLDGPEAGLPVLDTLQVLADEIIRLQAKFDS